MFICLCRKVDGVIDGINPGNNATVTLVTFGNGTILRQLYGLQPILVPIELSFPDGVGFNFERAGGLEEGCARLLEVLRLRAGARSLVVTAKRNVERAAVLNAKAQVCLRAACNDLKQACLYSEACSRGHIAQPAQVRHWRICKQRRRLYISLLPSQIRYLCCMANAQCV